MGLKFFVNGVLAIWRVFSPPFDQKYDIKNLWGKSAGYFVECLEHLDLIMQNLILKSLFLWSKNSVEDMISCLDFVIVWAWAMPMGAHCIFSSFGLGVLCRLIVHLD